ncbi:MAG: hypothetical protein AAF206_28340 [Bacteroidota bacterium]
MGLFCGKKCRCKNACNADLQWNPQAAKACREACGSDNPPASGYAFLEAQPAFVQNQYMLPNQIEQEFIETQQSGTGSNLILAFFGLLLLGAAAYFILR